MFGPMYLLVFVRYRAVYWDDYYDPTGIVRFFLISKTDFGL